MILPWLAIAILSAAQPHPRRRQHVARPQPQQRGVDSTPQQRGSDSLPVAVKLLNTGETKDEVNQDAKQAADVAEINRRQLTTNYILAGLAAASALLAWWTFNETRKVTRQQLRAYVMVHAAYLKFPNIDDVSALVRIKNFGRTPARQVRSWIHLRAANRTDPGTLPEPLVYPGTSVLAPGADEDIGKSPTRSEPLGDEEAMDNLGTANSFYIYGRVEYLDAFDQQHTTRFRFVYDGPGPGDESQRNMTPCADGNEYT